MSTNNSSPRQGLAPRHIRFIALGGAIGAGFFLGSGVSISRAGPGLLIAYAIAGAVIFLMARALGELALFRPATGAFSSYARELIGDRTGFLTGWSYWLLWILTGVAEITGIGVLMRFWYPHLPQWIPALAAVGFVYALNMCAVRFYGEFEYWLALVKIVTIIAMLACGLLLIFKSNDRGVANLLGHGGFLPNGWQGVLNALPVAVFAFGGVEIIGLTAAETSDPESALPRAINGVIYRILIFYIGSLAMIMLLFPWNQLDATQSPFVLVFERVGFPAAASALNLVVITAMLSSCNSGIFGGSRMLHSLSLQGDAPRLLQVISSRRVPSRCVTACVAMLLIGVGLNYAVPERVFVYLMCLVSALLLWTWGVIMVCHLAYRRRIARKEAPQVSFRLPASPYSNWLVLAFMGAVAILLALNPETRVAYYTAAGWFAFLLIWRRRRTRNP